MFTAVAVLTLLGISLGLLLGYADKIFAVEENPLVKEIESMLPGTHCGQCGFPGCRITSYNVCYTKLLRGVAS